MATTRTVEGTIKRPDGTAWASAPVRFLLRPASETTDTQFPSGEVVATTDANGFFSQVLWCNGEGDLSSEYLCELPSGDTFYFILGTGASPVSLSTLRLAYAGPSDPQYTSLEAYVGARYYQENSTTQGFEVGDMPYVTALRKLGRIAAVASGMVLLSGGVGAVPAWGQIADAHVSATAAIGWTKIAKTGSSLADLATRSAGDLSSGTLADARLSSNVPLLNAATNAFTQRITVAGNAALGASNIVAWGAPYQALQLGAAAAIMYRTDAASVYLYDNAYWNGTADIYRTNGFASQYYQSGASHIFKRAVSGVAGNPVTWIDVLTLATGTGAATFNGNLFVTGSAAPNYIEFSRTGVAEKGSIGALGSFEMNVSYNMDYSTAVHRFYDNTKSAHWIAMNDTGFYIQYAPASTMAGDVWTGQGSLLNLTMLSATGNATFRGSVTAAGLSSSTTLSVTSHLGLGTSDIEAWNAAYRAMQMGTHASIFWGASTNELHINSNAYFDTGEKYRTTAAAARYSQTNGVHRFYVAPSGTIDTVIPWVTALTIANDGAASFVGTLSTGGPLSVTGTGTFTDDIGFSASRGIRQNTPDGADNRYTYIAGGGAIADIRGAYIGLYGNEVTTYGGYVDIVAGNVPTGNITFTTAGAQRAQFSYGGVFAIGTTLTTGAAAGDVVLANSRFLRGVNMAGTNTIAVLGIDAADRVYINAASALLRIDNALTAITVGAAGAAAALPAAPVKYLRIMEGTTEYKIPLYTA